MSRRLDRFGAPVLFRSKQRGKSNVSIAEGSTLDDISTIDSENSFRYEPYESPLKSTQQLSVDFSKFENHTFFNSAIAKVSVAFNKIINKYPFDGTLKEIEEFEDKLTGYEKYILDIFPKHTGYMTLSGSSYIDVANIAGASFPEYSSNKSAKKVLDPIKSSISFEAFVRVNDDNDSSAPIGPMGLFEIKGTNINVQSVIKRDNPGFASASFVFSSGSFETSILTDPFEKDKFNHLSFVLDRENSKILSFVNGNIQSQTASILTRDILFNTDLSLLKNGTSGSASVSNFSGSIKDFRVYHNARDEKSIRKDFKKTVYKGNDLVLNFRFNEPTGSFSIENYALDTSGNSLHSKIFNFDRVSRILNENIENPVTNERKNRNHILFPNYYSVLTLQNELLNSGSSYDLVNPNLITKLIPPHYFEETIFEDGNYDGLSSFKNPVTGSSIPGSANNLDTGILSVLLLSWANIFDEIKMFIDSFGNIIFSDYRDEDISPDQMLTFAAKHIGIDLPPMFTSEKSTTFFDTEEVFNTKSTNRYSLKKIQSLIWKRILADASYYKKTKGTIDSIKSIFRSAGIEPDKMLAFIEKGANTFYLSDTGFEEKFNQIPLVNFSGSLADVAEGTISPKGFSPNKPQFSSFVLSGSRGDADFPHPDGLIKNVGTNEVGSNNREDGLYTSGSWSVEGYYRFSKLSTTPVTQSLARVQRFEIDTADYTDGEIAGLLNIVAIKDTDVFLSGSTDSVIAYFTDDINNNVVRNIRLDGVEIFDGDMWYVSFSKTRDDDPGNDSYKHGNKYSLNCAKYGTESIFTTSSFYTGSSQPVGASFASPLTKFTGSNVIIGSQSLDFNKRYGIYSVGSSYDDFNKINYTDFSGMIGSVRFWSKELKPKEVSSHSKNIDDYGVINPNLGSMFITSSFEKIRLNINANQPITSSKDSSKIIAINLTQAESSFSSDLKSSFDGFEINKSINTFEKIKYLSFPNKIEENNTTNKVRINSLNKNPNLDLGYQNLAPVYSLFNKHIQKDDARFSVEMSIGRIINDHINNEVATVQFYENMLGRHNSLFSENNAELDMFSRNFFKNIEGDINPNKLLSIYTWLESSFEEIIEKSLPKKTKFLGMNYVIEPHNLERSRATFNYEDHYMGGEPNNEIQINKKGFQVFNGEISSRWF